MPLSVLPRHPWAAIFAAAAAAIAAVAVAPPANADPLDPIPGEGVFLVGRDIAPGLYNTSGSAAPFAVYINDVPTQDSMCVWVTYSTPDTNKDHVVATNMSIGPMNAAINSTVMAFETHNCEPWARVS